VPACRPALRTAGTPCRACGPASQTSSAGWRRCCSAGRSSHRQRQQHRRQQQRPATGQQGRRGTAHLVRGRLQPCSGGQRERGAGARGSCSCGALSRNSVKSVEC
jgi:hypothetical protein